MSDVNPVWCVMPVLAGPEMTEAALADLLAQSLPTKVLVVNQGIDTPFRERLERLAEQDPRIYLWSHQPPLPSLSATWNRALDFIFGECAEPCAFLVNNDVRLHHRTVEALVRAMSESDGLFVSAVGVTQADFDSTSQIMWDEIVDNIAESAHGGPDFSCFLIDSSCHQRYRFDENFIPAFCEDLDYHRRLMLNGDGSRIFSVNLPYLHLASQTLKGGYLDEDQKAAIRASIERNSRTYYAKKWGGPVNHETFTIPFGREGVAILDDSATTPALQEALRGQDDRRTEPLRLTLAETPGSPGSGVVSLLPGDFGPPGDGALHVGGGDADGDERDSAAHPDSDAGDEPGAVEHPERPDPFEWPEGQ